MIAGIVSGANFLLILFIPLLAVKMSLWANVIYIVNYTTLIIGNSIIVYYLMSTLKLMSAFGNFTTP